MRKELKELEEIVEKAAENVKGDDNVERTYITLKAPVPLKKGFKSRYKWGRGNVNIRVEEDCEIIGFNFGCAYLYTVAIKEWNDEYHMKVNTVPLKALRTETLVKLKENAGDWKEVE